MFDRNFFVLAPSFHGATILSKLLNAHPEVVSLGDTYPSRNFDQICGCGNYVSQCPFWIGVNDAISPNQYAKEGSLLPTYPKITGSKADPLMYNKLPSYLLNRLINNHELEIYSTDYRRFLKEVYAKHAYKKPRVFIDGVKSISRVHALKLSGVPVAGVIHITRSPCDFVKSSEKQGRSLVSSALAYRMYHKMASKIQGETPYIRISYEELSTSTDQTLEKLFRFIQLPFADIDKLKENFDDTWHFMGNSSLLKFDGTMKVSQYSVDKEMQRKITRISGKQLPSIEASFPK